MTDYRFSDDRAYRLEGMADELVHGRDRKPPEEAQLDLLAALVYELRALRVESSARLESIAKSLESIDSLMPEPPK